MTNNEQKLIDVPMPEAKRYLAVGPMMPVDEGAGAGIFVAASDFDRVAAQKVAAVGLPEPITEDMNRLMEAYRLGEFKDEGGSATVEALSVASLDAATTGQDEDSYMAGFCAAIYWQAAPFIHLATIPRLDALEPLVAGLRAEVKLLSDNHTEAINVAMRCQKERDALRAEIERLKSDSKLFMDTDTQWRGLREQEAEINTLRTQNAELVGLLRECSEDLPGLAIAADGHRTWEGMVADKDPTVDLCSRIDTALSAYEGREGE